MNTILFFLIIDSTLQENFDENVAVEKMDNNQEEMNNTYVKGQYNSKDNRNCKYYNIIFF